MKWNSLGAREHRLEMARGLGKLAPLVGDKPEKCRAPARGEGQTVHLRELQLVGGRLLAAGEASRLPEHDDAPKVAPDRGRVDARRFAIGERRESRQRLILPSRRGQGHPERQVGVAIPIAFARGNARDGIFRGLDRRVGIAVGPVCE